MRYRSIVIACLSFGLMSCASARTAPLKLPDFEQLRGKATQTVDIDLGSFAFFLARRFVDDDDSDGAAIKNILQGVSSMRVRHYEFADDFVYARSDIDGVRSQLSARGWNPLMHTRNRKNQQDVDVYVSLDEEKITGFALVASEPREFTIVNIVGTLDPKQVAALREKFESDYGHIGRKGQEAIAGSSSVDVQTAHRSDNP